MDLSCARHPITQLSDLLEIRRILHVSGAKQMRLRKRACHISECCHKTKRVLLQTIPRHRHEQEVVAEPEACTGFGSISMSDSLIVDSIRDGNDAIWRVSRIQP